MSDTLAIQTVGGADVYLESLDNEAADYAAVAALAMLPLLPAMMFMYRWTPLVQVTPTYSSTRLALVPLAPGTK